MLANWLSATTTTATTCIALDRNATQKCPTRFKKENSDPEDQLNYDKITLYRKVLINEAILIVGPAIADRLHGNR